jgi:DNA-binding response OmpR family regulator
MELLLQRHGYEVGVAASVAEAMKLAKDRQYDMLISDVRLPDGNGFDLLKDLRASQKMKGICISGGSSDEDKRRGELAGFDEYLTKPVQVAELLEVIQRIQKDIND